MTIPATILWGEDSDDVYAQASDALIHLLSGHGIAATIQRAGDGNAVYRYLTQSKQHFDAIILDLDMPGYDGVEVIEEFSARGLGHRIVVVSGKLAAPEWQTLVAPYRNMVADVVDIGEFDKWAAAVERLIQSPPPTIVHCSDVHFGNFHAFDDSSDLSESLSSKIALVKEQLRPNVLVVSGDLASKGFDHEFAAAARFIEWIADELNIDAAHTVVVPGNHDISRPMEPGRRFDRYVEFLRIVYGEDSSALPDFARSPTPPRVEDILMVRELPDLRLVIAGLNSVRDDEAEWNVGRVSERQLAHLRSEMDRLKAPATEYLRVAVFHHHVFPTPSAIGVEDAPLENSALVLRDLASMNFRLLLHGHTHYPVIYEHRPLYVHDFKPLPPVFVASAGTLGGRQRHQDQPSFSFLSISVTLPSDSVAGTVRFEPFVRYTDKLEWEKLPVIEETFDVRTKR